MSALTAYVWRVYLASQLWVAPVVLTGCGLAVLTATTGSVLPAYAGVAVLLLFVSTWLSVGVHNAEDPELVAVTETHAGSAARVRLAKAWVAYQASAVLALVGLAGPALATPRAVTIVDLTAGLAAGLIASLAGVAAGSLLSRPIVRRAAWAVLGGVTIGVLDVLVPYGPPVRQLLMLFNGPRALAMSLAGIAIETVLLVVVAMAASLRLSRSRS